MNFGATLRGLLAERELSQAELARRVDVSAQSVSNWIINNKTPSRQHVTRLEDELDVEPRGFLLEAAGYSSDNGEQPTPESLLRTDPGFDGEDRRIILRLMRQARERHARSYDVDLEDEDEATIWGAVEYPEEQRWAWILRLRQHKTELVSRSGRRSSSRAG